PAIRFKGFSKRWTVKKLQDLTETGFSNGVFNDPQKVGKGYRLINVKDMYAGNSIDVESLSLVDIDEKEFKKNKVEYGDIFFTRSSLVKEGIAYSNVNLSNHQNITFDGHLIRMQPCKRSNNPVFLSSLFKTPSARNQFILGGKTTTMTTIGQSDIASVEVPIPSVEEQTKIGNYFQQLDTLIAQHQKKHDKLLNLKKALLELMFPKQGATEPKIRFKGFSGEWEEKGLEEISVKIQDGTHFSPKSFDTEDFLYITSKNVKNGYIELSKAQFISKEEHDNIYKRCDVKQGDVLLTKDGTIGQACVNELSIPFSLLSSVAFIRLNPNFSNYFLYHLLVSQIGQKEIESQIAGQALKRITLTKINNFSFDFPSHQEQQKIASCLSALDALITQHQAQLKKLSNIKQACLEKMFV
ncbi:MAG: restriction endonuclease subunit S, partial [Methylobacter sp.]|nr:restriction endonuclease subunit S [Methylobacter sp.]